MISRATSVKDSWCICFLPWSMNFTYYISLCLEDFRCMLLSNAFPKATVKRNKYFQSDWLGAEKVQIISQQHTILFSDKWPKICDLLSLGDQKGSYDLVNWKYRVLFCFKWCWNFWDLEGNAVSRDGSLYIYSSAETFDNTSSESWNSLL